ncbi:MAG: hypothetical protein MRZ79_08195 [Bacteroidia bacterium]|nr:hypothetical protein [Bacteroidia bacterium]
MTNHIRLDILLLILLVGILTACDSAQGPPCLNPPQTELHKRMKKVMEVVHSDNLKDFQFEVDGLIEEKDQLWSEVTSPQPEVYIQKSITNIYEKNKSHKEYYALEQIIDLSDTTNRQPIFEYQFVVNSDTAFVRVFDEKELRYTGISVDGIYLLEGYAHDGDPSPEQFRWWSPTYGDLIIWYGEKRFLTLTKPISPEIRQLLEVLKQKFEQP